MKHAVHDSHSHASVWQVLELSPRYAVEGRTPLPYVLPKGFPTSSSNVLALRDSTATHYAKQPDPS